MAALQQTIAPAPEITLFSGLPLGTNNIYPRARVSFINNVQIALKLAGNTNRITYNMDLPLNYAYRLDQLFVSFTDTGSLDVDNFELLGLATLNLATPINMILQSQGISSIGSVLGSAQVWTLPEKYGETFQVDAAARRLTIDLFDNDGTNNSDALASSLRVSFLQYDILQVTDVSVNAPQPVTVV